MATDKSINIRQVKATEQLAESMAAIKAQIEALNKRFDTLEVRLDELKPVGPKVEPSRFEQASRAASKK